MFSVMEARCAPLGPDTQQSDSVNTGGLSAKMLRAPLVLTPSDVISYVLRCEKLYVPPVGLKNNPR